MHISWSFLDKRKGTVDAIESYKAMEFIIKTSGDDIEAARSKMEGVKSLQYDGMPHASNPQSAEDRILDGIAEIDVLKERYRQAVEYMDWFVPAWQQLSEDEQFVLEAFYVDDEVDGVSCISNHYDIERSSAYNKKNRALNHLTTLLFGKS